MALLNFRFGYGTWDELKEMRPRLQSKEKKKFMLQAELRRNMIEAVSIFALISLCALVLGGVFYFIAKSQKVC